MDIESKFNDLGVDALTGIQLMKSLNLSPSDFIDEARFLRFKDIIDFFKNIPDREYILNKITVGKNVDKLDHTWSYVQLLGQKDRLKNEVEKNLLKLDTMNLLGEDDSFLKQNLSESKVELSKINEQINKYEL